MHKIRVRVNRALHMNNSLFLELLDSHNIHSAATQIKCSLIGDQKTINFFCQTDMNNFLVGSIWNSFASERFLIVIYYIFSGAKLRRGREILLQVTWE